MQRTKGALSSRHIIRNNSGCEKVTKDDMSALENVGKRVSQLTIACAVVVGLLLTAEHGAAQSVGVSGTAEQVYKNIKVLQGSPADSFNQAMHLISGALGVNCEYCHKEMDFVSDEVKKKDAARGMITMTAELNQRVFQGKQVITCYTCHQGNAIPRNTPLLPLAGPAADNRREIELPSAAEVLSKQGRTESEENHHTARCCQSRREGIEASSKSARGNCRVNGHRLVCLTVYPEKLPQLTD